MSRPSWITSLARATGESPARLRRLGFQPRPAHPRAGLEPEDLALAVDCPFCGHPSEIVITPAGLPDLADCDRCDVEFAYDPAEIVAVDRVETVPVADRAVA